MPSKVSNRTSLTGAQRRIIEIYTTTAEYVGSKACILYQDETGEPFAQSSFSTLLRRDDAIDYIEELQKQQGVRVSAVRNRVLEELGVLAFSNLTDVVYVTTGGGVAVRDFDTLPDSVKKAVRSIKLTRKKGFDGEYEDVLEIMMHDKKGALDSLSNILNLQRRIGEELNKDEEASALQFAGVKIIGPDSKKVDLSLPLLEEKRL